MKCFYHGDLDGKCSAFWVNKYFDRDIDLREIDYSMAFPFEDIEKDESVWIVDFSIEPEEMKKLLDITKNVVWIDHHKSVIEKYKNLSLVISGIWEIGQAGCELTYKYLYDNEIMPKMTRLIGDWDVWEFEYGDETEYFKMGMEVYNTHPESKIWERVLSNPKSVIQDGKIVYKFKKNFYKEYVGNYGYEVGFERLSCIVCNIGMVSSKLFESLDKDYDILIKYVFDGNQYIVSLYSKNVDVSEIAEKYGGGGHEGAAGFQCDELPF